MNSTLQIGHVNGIPHVRALRASLRLAIVDRLWCSAAHGSQRLRDLFASVSGIGAEHERHCLDMRPDYRRGGLRAANPFVAA